jgi:septal ring factor EnvC (AmiA/AmiB activator)
MEGKIMVKKIIRCVPLLLIFGCATTDDPRQGGLWSYNPEAYEKRLEERRVALREIQGNQRNEENTTKHLKSELSAKKEKFTKEEERLESLTEELSKIRHDINQYQAKTNAQYNKKKRVQNEIQRLNNQIKALQDQAQLSEIEKDKKITSLKREINELLELTLLLTQ